MRSRLEAFLRTSAGAGACLLVLETAACSRSVGPFDGPSDVDAGDNLALTPQQFAGVYDGWETTDVVDQVPADGPFVGGQGHVVCAITATSQQARFRWVDDRGSSSEVWPDGATSDGCDLPFVVDGGVGTAIPGAICTLSDGRRAYVGAGEFRLEGNILHAQGDIGEQITSNAQTYDLQVSWTFDGQR
jgi:hypothetical protein